MEWLWMMVGVFLSLLVTTPVILSLAARLREAERTVASLLRDAVAMREDLRSTTEELRRASLVKQHNDRTMFDN